MFVNQGGFALHLQNLLNVALEICFVRYYNQNAKARFQYFIVKGIEFLLSDRFMHDFKVVLLNWLETRSLKEKEMLEVRNFIFNQPALHSLRH